MSQIEKLQSKLEDAEDRARNSKIFADGQRVAREVFEARADKAESELFALGIQCEALKERLKLADGLVDEVRVVLACTGGEEDWGPLGAALAAFDAVPGDVSPPVKDACMCAELSGACAVHPSAPPPEPEPDPRPRYDSGEVPMMGDVVTNGSGDNARVTGLAEDGEPILNGGIYYDAEYQTLVRRAAPPASDLLARAVALLREHAYDVRVIDFLADFDKGGV